jgi:hypothetical protein
MNKFNSIKQSRFLPVSETYKKLTIAMTLCIGIAVPTSSQTEQAKVTTATQEKIEIDNSIPPVHTLSSLNEISKLMPSQTGIEQDTLIKQKYATSKRALPYALDKPEVRAAKFERLGWQMCPQITITRLERFNPLGEMPKGAVSVEGAFFPEIPRNPSGGYLEKELSALQAQREANRKVTWRWDIPKELSDAYLLTSHGVLMRTQPDERFVPLRLARASKKNEKDSKKDEPSINMLYFFDALKGMVWSRDLKPLLQGEGQQFGDIEFATVQDGSHTVIVATTEQNKTGGSRIIVLGDKGQVISITDIKGVFIPSITRNDSRNSFIIRLTVLYIQEKPFQEDPRSMYMLLNHNGSIVGYFSNKEGKLIASGAEIFADDRVAASYTAGVLYDLPTNLMFYPYK